MGITVQVNFKKASPEVAKNKLENKYLQNLDELMSGKKIDYKEKEDKATSRRTNEKSSILEYDDWETNKDGRKGGQDFSGLTMGMYTTMGEKLGRDGFIWVNYKMA